VGVVPWLAMAQLRHRPGRWGLLALGIALTIAIPVISAGIAESVAAQTVRRTVSQLDPSDRSLLVTQEPQSVFRTGTPAQDDARVRAQLAQLTSKPVRRELVYRELTLAGSSFFLAGADDLKTAVRVVAGRLPTQCTPTRCEVVLVGPGDPQQFGRAVASLGVVVVGRAVRTDPMLVSGRLGTGGLPLLVGDGADAMGALTSLQLFSRTVGWAADLDVEQVVRLGVPAYVQRGADVDAVLSRTVGGTTLFRPDDVLQAEDQRATLSARRFGLLGGCAAVLMLGFAVVAAVGLRREHELLLATLRRRGATNRQVRTLTGLETGTTCALGAVAGVAAGAIVAAVLATQAGLAVGATAASALGRAGIVVAALTVAAAVVATLVLVWPESQSRTIWHLLDLLALCCIGAVILAADRGNASTADLAGGNDPLVVALPVLSAVTAGLIAARLWSPLGRLAERALPRRSVAGRIALLGSLRRPLRPLATTAFLTAAVASVVFAGTYRSTLLAGSADQAAYTVPLDATLQPSTEIISPATVVDSAALAARVPGAQVFGITRTGASVQTTTGTATSLEVVGLDPAAIAQMHRWSRTTGSGESAQAIANELRAAPRIGPQLPGSARSLSLQVSGMTQNITVSLWLRDDSGREGAVALQPSTGRLQGTVPALGDGPLRAVALVVEEQPDYATHRQHALGEGNTDQPVLAGTLTFGQVQVDGAAVPWDWSGWGTADGTARTSGERFALSYRLESSTAVATPAYVPDTDLPTLPIATDPVTAIAARDGALALQVGGQQVSARVVAVLPRLPTVDGSFVLTDRAALVDLLDRSNPGSGNPTELWVSVPSGSRQALADALSTDPYDRLTVTLRSGVEADLAADPVGRGSRILLVAVGALALAVAAASLVLLVVAERRDGTGEMFAWESDGVRPATLRRMLFLRTLAVVAVGLPLGLLAGYAVASIGARLIAVDAAGSTPQPPLQTTLGSAWTVLALAAGLGAGIAAVALVAASALRERLPVRPEVDLR
jgi:hypothetical protein